MIGLRILSATALMLAAEQVDAQSQAADHTPDERPGAEPGADIVVDGLRDLDDPASPVTRSTLGSGKTGTGASLSRATFSVSGRFARCTIHPGTSDLTTLRNVLDGAINGARQRFWQARFVSRHAACAQDPGVASSTGVATIEGAYDTSYYDRGALFIQALNVFAPDLVLTRKQTADPVVQARFNAREIPLERFRLPVDRSYFETSVCLVRLQPELSVRLVKTTDSPSIARLEAAIINKARTCTGDARKVYFDPSQFRMYIADAVYRWAVAAKGTDSLIPAG